MTIEATVHEVKCHSEPTESARCNRKFCGEETDIFERLKLRGHAIRYDCIH